MAKGLLSDLDDQMFILNQQLDIFEMAEQLPSMENVPNLKTLKLLLNEVRNFALKEILPTNAIGDTRGPSYSAEDGKVIVPIEFLKLWNDMAGNGFIAMTEDPDRGGEGLPHVVGMACQEWYTAANFAFMMYPGLSREVGKMLEKFPTVQGMSKDAVDAIIKGLFTGTYGGTMCLTEPDAGSDVGAVKTEAVPNVDSTGQVLNYTLTGNKIFITNGEHGMAKNIIHAVLARTPNAPAGTKGISLFLVPRDIDGKNNNVHCTGIEEKMGIHGNATCSMSFDGAEGYLIGEENKGMKIMFSLMNEARLMVASQGLGAMSAAYQYALDYAKTRKQGRSIENIADQSAPSVAIIEHPDVRRQLMYMRSHVAGCRSFLYWLAYQMDLAAFHDELGDTELRDKCLSYVDLLTSLAKGVLTDRAVKVCDSAVQIHGGVGYTKEYPVEQLLRDVRITPIYEGTNGIQAMDFLFRRVPKDNGKAITALIEEIKSSTADIGLSEKDELAKKLDRAAEIIMTLLFTKADYPAGYAHVVMDSIGDLLIAWQLLLRVKTSTGPEEIYTMKFFFRNVLPASWALLESLERPDPSHLVAKF